ncbi:Uncharacterised protein [Salmonella enterica subsp. enterica serovar Typhi]|nr:Uncharacterised protein [Salmonella enterica subsp. enterica serovar Typhi]CRB76332.1 Uncharacterised protein [Salmonella enterica subsp. enterica serovar Typhi]
MAENGPIEDLAKRISEDLLSRFKWQQHGPCDRDFLCDDEAKLSLKVRSRSTRIL